MSADKRVRELQQRIAGLGEELNALAGRTLELSRSLESAPTPEQRETIWTDWEETTRRGEVLTAQLESLKSEFWALAKELYPTETSLGSNDSSPEEKKQDPNRP